MDDNTQKVPAEIPAEVPSGGVDIKVGPSKDGKVVIAFSRPISDLAMTLEQARGIALSLRQVANAIEHGRK